MLLCPRICWTFLGETPRLMSRVAAVCWIVDRDRSPEMTATAARPVRVATEARWTKALERAAAYGIAPRRVGADRWAVASAAGTLVYLVAANADGMTCTCKA